jgi:cation diffusion facilitator family transporter
MGGEAGRRAAHVRAREGEYFSAGIEGTLIFGAALAIAVTAVQRLLEPTPIDHVGLGLAVSTGASLINLAVGLVLPRAGRRHRSITLEADGRHLMTDVWTSAGVVVGVAAVAITGWDRLDGIIALLVAANIVVTGAKRSHRCRDGA